MPSNAPPQNGMHPRRRSEVKIRVKTKKAKLMNLMDLKNSTNSKPVVLTLIALIALLTASVVFSGCVELGGGNGAQNDGVPQGGGQFRGENGGFANTTPEQMQAIQQERTQAALTACEGKNEGDACVVQMRSPENRNLPGNFTGENPSEGNTPAGIPPAAAPNGNWTGNGTEKNRIGGASGIQSGTCEAANGGALSCVLSR